MARPNYIHAKDGDSHAEIHVYASIGESWWEETVDAKTFARELATLEVDTIDVRINSLGGDAFDGQAIYNALRRHPAQVTTYVDGIAASAASTIALAGDRVVIAKNAMLMIHNPAWVCWGGADDMRHAATILDKLRDAIATVYVEHSDMTLDDVKAALDAETWYTAEEALELGFADAIDEDAEADLAPVAKLEHRIAARAQEFRHAPERIASMLREAPPIITTHAHAVAAGIAPAASAAAITSVVADEVIEELAPDVTSQDADEGAGNGVDIIDPEAGADDDERIARVVDLLAM